MFFKVIVSIMKRRLLNFRRISDGNHLPLKASTIPSTPDGFEIHALSRDFLILNHKYPSACAVALASHITMVIDDTRGIGIPLIARIKW